MIRVLFVIPHLEYSGAARQLQLLATALPRNHFEVRVCVLGRLGPVAEPLREAGIKLEALGWTRVIDLNAMWSLRRLVAAFAPSVIHTWRLASLWVVQLAGRKKCKLVASAVELPPNLSKLQSWMIGRLLSRADRVSAYDAAGAKQLQQCGLADGKALMIRPAVAQANLENLTPVGFRQALGLSADARLVLCVGPLEPHKGFRDAIWTLDILRYLYDNLHLVLIGDGSDLPRLEQFARATRGNDRSHFAGCRANVPALLTLGEVIWVPSQKHGGVNVALEAMAAGRPVVAARLPSLVEVVADGETGHLVPPGNKVELARRTRSLLGDPERRRLMGEAGQRRAQDHFSIANMVERFTRLYEEVSGTLSGGR